ncbi:MAG: ATP-dependent RecD-like DNA helicase [Desulfovibrio sp.]|jgi:exodeoxyribonuclease V alpha subunit|nr:ATP-dependent RecD-like DNA helicase [Desulfovibrio sp.]
MNTQSSPDEDERRTLRGTVDRVVFHNEENCWTVLRLKLQSLADPVTVVGELPSPQPGAALSVTGVWVNDPRFGRQFKMTSFESLLPADIDGIMHYLGSGLIKGVGPGMARRIVNKFGQDAFRVLDEEPELLTQIRGISPRKLEGIKTAWAEHRGIKDLIMFLQPHGISAAYAVRIFREYGAGALDIVKENPYRLAMDIRGIGFVTADAIAMKLGFDPGGVLRAQAGLLYLLRKLGDEGHVFFPLEELVHKCADELRMETQTVRGALRALSEEHRVVIDELSEDLGRPHFGVYLTRYYHYEKSIAHYLRRILNSPKSVHFPDPEVLLAGVLSMLPLELADEQIKAARAALSDKLLVITGGPGTGKTTVINAIIKLYEKRGAKVLLAAPTGRAARRMAEATEKDAKTIHRLLEYSPREDGFARNENHPLACGLLVIDEASMLDTMLMCHLVKALPLGSTLVLAGDVNQLPSVGPGNVLGDIMKSGAAKIVCLTEIFRQAAESDIIVNAHLINRGEVPSLHSNSRAPSDFYFIRRDDPAEAAALIIELVRERIPNKFRFHPVDEIQVLSPMHKGATGVEELNARLQAALNSQEQRIKRGGRSFYLGDKVMQTRNNYDKEVFNGDIGRICLINEEDREVVVRYEDKNVLYSYEELDEISMAYAVSVHKSQGSEYPAVVIPVLTEHYMLLQRNLLYTGVTRGKRLVVLVGSPRAMHMAVGNNRMNRRYSWLDRRLGAEQGGGL